MYLIREVVQQALTTGYLSVAAEEDLRQLLQKRYDLEDLDAFMALQQEAMAGRVTQESRELIKNQYFGRGNLCTPMWEADVA
ncbi:hypothetical protein [Argonema galeatum]|uniref:hypothetical protein n=1 Tax=Argonema galeatum TaxID=2942762 RepID=UPI0020133F6B|nr:hypothetical protein [Argonema galeatum]MCL1468372.1 hypothetical protein [Argonema galeatum A003/A1]